MAHSSAEPSTAPLIPASVAWFSHPDCLLHDMGRDHPECPQRLIAIEENLRVCGYWDFMSHVVAPQATPEQLKRAHNSAYVDSLLRIEGQKTPVLVDPDTVLMAHTIPAALRAAGAAVAAVDWVMSGRAKMAFCAVRPPGHHAEHAQAMGFCFFNNIAVAACEALEKGLERVAILDFDVHYGNGTAEIFRKDPRITLFSTYQHPLYPYWEGRPDATNLVDVPLPAYTTSQTFRQAVEQHWLPALDLLKPQLILVSAGFDAHEDDDMAQMRLKTADFGWLGSMIERCARRHCDGRVVATLEGGYNLAALACSVEAFLAPFIGDGT